MKKSLIPALVVAMLLWVSFVRPVLARPSTVEGRITQFGAAARLRLKPHFRKAGIAYPPARVGLVYFKSTQTLELYASGSVRAAYKFVRSFPVQAASGELGPKLRQGDRQVPEGIYRITDLNPNSAYHVSMRVNYPNAFDREQARDDKRTGLGGDIMIHGQAVSIGCLAMGDSVAEELFTLAYDSGHYRSWDLLLAPLDFRKQPLVATSTRGLPVWTGALYKLIEEKLKEFPQP